MNLTIFFASFSIRSINSFAENQRYLFWFSEYIRDASSHTRSDSSIFTPGDNISAAAIKTSSYSLIIPFKFSKDIGYVFENWEVK